jgi:hypothetical protein
VSNRGESQGRRARNFGVKTQGWLGVGARPKLPRGMMRHKFSLSLGFSSCLRGTVNRPHTSWTCAPCSLSTAPSPTYRSVECESLSPKRRRHLRFNPADHHLSCSKCLASRDLSQAVLLHTSTVLKMVQSLLICWLNKFGRMRAAKGLRTGAKPLDSIFGSVPNVRQVLRGRVFPAVQTYVPYTCNS